MNENLARTGRRRVDRGPIDPRLLAAAAEAGRAAFRSGRPRSSVPALDPTINEIIRSLPRGGPIGQSIPYLEAFQRAWTEENLRAPVPEWTPEEQAAWDRNLAGVVLSPAAIAAQLTERQRATLAHFIEGWPYPYRGGDLLPDVNGLVDIGLLHPYTDEWGDATPLGRGVWKHARQQWRRETAVGAHFKYAKNRAGQMVERASGVKLIGKPQKAVVTYLATHGGRAELADIARAPSLRGVHLKRIVSAIDALKKNGVVEYVESYISLVEPSSNRADSSARSAAVARTSERDVEQVEQIAQQLGGTRRLAVMIGANTFTAGPGVRLSFRFKARPTRNGANAVQITLEPSDTYRVVFMSARGTSLKLKGQFEDVYADALKPLFERETGLRLSL